MKQLPTRRKSDLNDPHLSLKRLNRREWWLWWTAFAIMLLLLAAVGSLVLPSAVGTGKAGTQASLMLHVRLLAYAVFLFALYAIYQQIVVKRLRTELLAQVEENIALQVRAEDFRNQAIRDPLTGIYNRRMVEEQLAVEIQRSKRRTYHLTVLAFDLNDFKQINDTFGHATGDLVLKSFSERLLKSIRASDTAGRIGGDEFLIVLPECQGPEAERVVARMNNLQLESDRGKITIAFSSGWAQYRASETSKLLLERADQELYKDKRARKGLAPASH